MRQHGFNLIELMIVIAIIAILFAIFAGSELEVDMCGKGKEPVTIKLNDDQSEERYERVR